MNPHPWSTEHRRKFNATMEKKQLSALTASRNGSRKKADAPVRASPRKGASNKSRIEVALELSRMLHNVLRGLR